MYSHIRLKETNFENYYQGSWPKTLLYPPEHALGENVIDMSAIAGDGNETQYTFLEAIDSERNLILNSNWFTEQNELSEYSQTASTPQQLAELIQQKPKPINRKLKQKILNNHKPQKIAETIQTNLNIKTRN